jgi:uncharacterized protein YjbI with pentapeptide repeats
MTKAIIIRGLDGTVRLKFNPKNDFGAKVSWSHILQSIGEESSKTLRNMDFSSLIKEQVNLKNLHFSNCIFDFDEMQRSIFVGCTFTNVRMSQSSFHYVGDRSDKADRSLGALFKRCQFQGCRINKCDFVMSKFFDCAFEDCSITKCDLRNVFWFERGDTQAQVWSDLPDMGDPFQTSRLQDVRFGHPVANIMSLPIQMMIPPSYASVWRHMGPVQRKLTKLSYLMSEESGEAFSSHA